MDLPKKILIVEDDLALLRILSDRLSKEGFSVAEAHDGLEGLKLAFDSHPDLILLDIIMPQLDGLSVLKKLREEEISKNIPVIIITNTEDLGAVSGAMDEGSYDYIIKSDWKLEDLVSKIKEKFIQ